MLIEIKEYHSNANMVKDLILERLTIDKLITDDQAVEYAEKWQVIIFKKNWFQRWTNKFSKGGDGYIYKYVRFED